MLRQIWLLMRITACNTFGLNVYRYTKDVKKRRRWRAMAVLWVFLFLLIEAYVFGLCAGLTQLDAAELIPQYLFTACSLAIFFFSFFKASAVLFDGKSLQTLLPLPLSGASIICSRFLSMYLGNLAISAALLLPGILWYGIVCHAGAGYFGISLLCLLFAPLLPVTLASAAGAGISAISARTRHKSIAAAGLSILLIVAILLLSALAGNAQQLNPAILQNLAGSIAQQLQRIYPPAGWFADASMRGDGKALVFLFLASACPFAVLVLLVGRRFSAICSALSSATAKGGYRMRKLHSHAPLHALWRRELQRYFASSIYVSNTLTGYVLMIVLSAGLLIAGPARIDAALGLPGLTPKLVPYALGLIAAMMPVTSCSISMEGRQFWIARTLPLRTRDILTAKLLLNLSIAVLPYFFSVILAAIALRPTFSQLTGLLLIPAAYILFSSISGLAINLALPVLEWDSELRVVKQSASTAFCLLSAFVSALIPIGILLAFPTAPIWWVSIPVLLILAGLSIVLFLQISHRDLAKLGV